jgi:hypothetical protein
MSRLLLFALFVLSGCADLSGVREFASLSASITGSTELSQQWRDAAVRLKRVEQPGDLPIGITIPDRTRVHDETEKILLVVTTYMDVMGQLAADSLPAVDQQVGKLASALSALPGTPITASRVQAVSLIGSLISKPLDAYRHMKVRQLILEADPALQSVLSGLQELAKIYQSDFAAERDYLRGWATVQIAGTGKTPADFLARRYMADLDRKYAELDSGIAAYVKALQTIARRHETLVNGLATDETIKRTLVQLQATRKELIDARDRIRHALAQNV